MKDVLFNQKREAANQNHLLQENEDDNFYIKKEKISELRSKCLLNKRNLNLILPVLLDQIFLKLNLKLHKAVNK